MSTGRPIALIENAFPMDGAWQEQIEIYFEVTVLAEPTTHVKSDHVLRSREPHLGFRWFTASECEGLDIRPAAVRRLLRGMDDAFLYVGRTATTARRPAG